jgi:beta-galactosidase
VRSLKITNKKGLGLEFTAVQNPFIFNAHRFTPDQLLEWSHTGDVKTLDTVCLNIDGFISGIGSNSCGPRTEKIYRLYANKTYTYKLAFKLISK